MVLAPLTFDSLFNSLFYEAPAAQSKPPAQWDPVVKDDTMIGVSLEMALAGFDPEKDVEIWTEGRTLHVKGDNTESGVSKKFSSRFHHRYSFRDKADLEKVDVKFNHGLLVLTVPFKEETIPKRTKIWG